MQLKLILNYDTTLAIINIHQLEMGHMDKIYIGLGDLQSMIISPEQHLKVGITKYNTITITSGKPIGHFTAMIWKSAVKVGFGYAYGAQSGGFSIYVTANYSPVTNIIGQFGQNVPRPIS